MVEQFELNEEYVLECLGMKNIGQLKEILSKNLAIQDMEKIKIEYDEDKKGSFKINGGIPFNKLVDGRHFGKYSPEERKSIFYGLPIINHLIQYDRPIGGDICAYTKLYEEYPNCRSNREVNFTPVGWKEENDLINISNRRTGHILSAWLVDRFFYKVSFSPEEKAMMFFTQSKWSNESVLSKGELHNHYRYEEELKNYLESDKIEFRKFRYSVLLIYKEKDALIPIATLLQLDTDNPGIHFNALVPNVDYVINIESN